MRQMETPEFGQTGKDALGESFHDVDSEARYVFDRRGMEHRSTEAPSEDLRGVQQALRDAQACLNSRKAWGDDWEQLARVTLLGIIQHLSIIEKGME